jgi:hypothetical protein
VFGLITTLAPALTPGRLTQLLAGARDRVPVPDVTHRGVWAAIEPPTRAGLLAQADEELAGPLPRLRASDWARTFRDGVRTAWEDEARRLRERAARLVIAAVLTGEVAAADAPPGTVAYLDGAADALVALAESSTWCWAPHDGLTRARGEVLPDPDDPYLDLGAAEVCSLFAWADHALGPHLDTRVPGLRRRLRREVDLRVLTPFERRRDWPWIGLRGDAHNWNPWIHSAVLAGTLLLVDDAERQASLVRLVVDGLDRYLAVLPADGGVDEGIGYWWQGVCRLMEALDLLAAAGGDELDARHLPPLPELARFPHRMHLGGDWYVNAGDAPARLNHAYPWHTLYAWGRRIDDGAVCAHAIARARPGLPVSPATGLWRALVGLADQGWRDAHGQPVHPGPWLPWRVWLPDVQVLVVRDATGVVLAAKGGHNGERHNHLDVGSYWVALDGRPLVVDAGQPTYTAASFGPHRYETWAVHSDWHNVPAPGAPQQPGAGYGARDVRAEDSGLCCDLAGAYPEDLVTSWQRSVRLIDGQVVVDDAWSGASTNVAVRHLLAGEVALGDGEAVARLPDGPGLRVSWDASVASPRLDRMPIDDPLLAQSWGTHLTRLTLTASGSDGRLTVWLGRAR